ncbi:hypothetical protein CHLNCDRAFT_137813 [Chlorella variabilis]|uniref:Dilute domain-containing protein n=1 Tax=Chlorella variabilis TaxID=554065 RepID=E1Z4J8_CHLVA|nr:hypothetical protein CHLNCDRAFT_137813 [Chlorella variabilis]EFN59072.1 hypothetical protein CHLNCDRAFT_137813 [Chlorella variabilis]|eukprot:XP_005851174.1 hypothetical protein CHLNCDRAFT_137813 [Chlorella variabilis]
MQVVPQGWVGGEGARSGQAPPPLQRSLLGASGSMRAQLSLAESVVLASPSDQLAGAADSLVVEALLHELRGVAALEEEALELWVQGLGAVEQAVREPYRPAPAPRAHLALLHRQLIVAVLRRLDTLLFRKLLVDEGEGLPLRLPSMGGRDAFSRGAEADEVLGGGGDAAAVGLLEPALLPFARGALTFGTGVSLKMAVSRLNSWAADCGVKEERMPQARGRGAGRSTEMSDYRLFPCLRATADLLMMPKQARSSGRAVLADPQMRREVVPGLPLHRVCQLLERFEPDDNAPDPLPPGLLEALHSESPRSDGGSTPSPTAKAEEEYAAPSGAALLAEGKHNWYST